MIEVEFALLSDGSCRGAVLIDGKPRLWTVWHATQEAAQADVWQVMDLLGWQRHL